MKMLLLFLVIIMLTKCSASQQTFSSRSPNSVSRTKQVIHHSGRTIAVTEVDRRDRMVECWLTIKKEGEQILNTVVIKTGKRADMVKKVNLQQMVQLMRDCQEVDQSPQMDKHQKYDQSKGNTDLPILSYLRQQLMYEGSKWCGFGNTAKNYFDIGSDRNVDRCCRAHDFCPVIEKRFTSRNPSPISKMACECDRSFFDCLQSLNSRSADKVGNIFFNAAQVDCVEMKQSLKCLAWKDSRGAVNYGNLPTGTDLGTRCVVWEEDDNTEPEVVFTNLGMEYPYTLNNSRSSLDMQNLKTIKKDEKGGKRSVRSASPVISTDFNFKSPTGSIKILQKSTGSIKILNLNIWALKLFVEDSKERLDALAEHLLNENYDVVFIQELWYNDDFHQIKNTFPYSTNYGSPDSRCPSIANNERYLVQPVPLDCNGLTILSRTTIKDTRLEYFKVQPALSQHFARRGILRTRTVIEGKKVSLIDTHLAAWYTGRESDYSNIRVDQAEQLVDVAKAEEEWADLVIVAGDMNSTPGSPVMGKIAGAGLKDALEEQYKFATWGHRGNTYTSQDKAVRIDYILYKGISGSYEVTSANILDLKANIDGQKKSISDHEGIEIVIKLL